MRIALGIVVVSTLLLAGAPAAEARQWVRHDGSGDMHSLYDQDPYKNAPGQADGDITRVQLKHNRRYVQLFVKMRDINRDTETTELNFNLENGRHLERHVRVSSSTSSSTHAETLSIESVGYQPVRCRGKKGFSINWASNVVAVTLPRTCLGRPKFLRLNANSYVDGNASDHLSYVDDAGTAGLPSEPWEFQHPEAWSPWVKRG